MVKSLEEKLRRLASEAGVFTMGDVVAFSFTVTFHLCAALVVSIALLQVIWRSIKLLLTDEGKAYFPLVLLLLSILVLFIITLMLLRWGMIKANEATRRIAEQHDRERHERQQARQNDFNRKLEDQRSREATFANAGMRELLK